MKIEVSASGIPLTETLRVHAERQVRGAVKKYSRWVLDVSVSLASSDIGPGAGGKECRIRMGIVGHKGVTEHESAKDIYIAIDRAVERVSRSMANRLALRGRA